MAREFASRGSKLFLLARDREKLTAARDKLLTEFGAVSVETLRSMRPITGCPRLPHNDRSGKGGLHALVANAGMIRCGRFEDQTDEDLTGTLSVNYLGVTQAIRAAWPFLARETGHIAIVSSVAGYLGIIGQSTYAPTKGSATIEESGQPILGVFTSVHNAGFIQPVRPGDRVIVRAKSIEQDELIGIIAAQLLIDGKVCAHSILEVYFS